MKSHLSTALLLILGLGLLAAALPAPAEEAPPFFPPGDFLPDWRRPTAPRAYRGEALYDHIDGGAEPFLEMGFRVCWVQRYGGPGGVEAVLEEYVMADAAAALGIFLLQTGPQGDDPALADRIAVGRSQGRAVRGNRYLVATLTRSFDGSGEAVRRLLALTLEKIGSEPDPSCLGWLPREGRVPASLRLARGPLGLQAILPFAEEDLLALRKTGATAVGADYRRADGIQTLLAAEYPDEAAAREGAAAWCRALGWPEGSLSGPTPDRRAARLAWEGRRIRLTVEPAATP